MVANKRATWSAAKWCEGEIDDLIDSYEDDDRTYQASFVLEGLCEGRYRDELTDAQVDKAIAYLGSRSTK